MKASSGRNTIADVARHAGVSKATVSRFLNHRDTLLSPETALRVEAAIAELGYVPSPMAQSLKRGRSGLIGLVVADIANPYSVAVLRGAERACRQAGYLVMLFNLGNESEREIAGLRALSSYKVEGFILNTMGHDTGALFETATQGRPVVLVDRLHRGLDVDFVSLDNHQAVIQSVEHLQDQGYRTLMLVTQPLGNVSSRMERAQAFTDYLSGHAEQLAGLCYESASDNEDGLVQALRTLRSQSQSGPPAVISANAVVTLQVVAAVTRLGWRLGQDIGLIGIDDTPWAPYVGPGVSAVAQPTDQLGILAAQCLLQRVGGLNVPARKMVLPGLLVGRGSTIIEK